MFYFKCAVAMAGESGKLQVFWDPHSQPSRAVVIFCRINKIECEEVYISLPTGAHKTPEYLKINPAGQVPAINDNGFSLFESSAILKYLSASRGAPDHWYPKDLKLRAQIDCVLDWHISNTRRGATALVFNKVVASVFMGAPSNPKAAEEGKALLVKALDMLDGFWCKEGPFLCGSKEVSIADLIIACELTELKLLDVSEESELLASRKNVTKWLQAVEDATTPVFDEVHGALFALSKQVREPKAKATTEQS